MERGDARSPSLVSGRNPEGPLRSGSGPSAFRALVAPSSVQLRSLGAAGRRVPTTATAQSAVPAEGADRATSQDGQERARAAVGSIALRSARLLIPSLA